MGVTYKCMWCGKKYTEPLNYQGSMKGMLAYMDNRTAEITAKCCGLEKTKNRRNNKCTEFGTA